MPDLFVRDIPADVKSWIDSRSSQLRRSRKEVVVDALRQAWNIDQGPMLFDQQPDSTPLSSPQGLPFTFIDLFAGIGGLRLGMERNGGQCVFSSEWDKFAQKTYYAWYGDMPAGDICKIDPADIPDHDILTAGFPCQPFSIAGVSKKNSLGKAHGFNPRKFAA